MIDLPTPPIDLLTVSKGRRLVQVIIAILKTQPEEVTGVGLHKEDFWILLDMLGYPCSTALVTLHKVKVVIEDIEQDKLHLHTKNGNSKIFVEDVWVILHPEEETRLHRVLREGVI
jgi:hypothetical protein